jgi:hypothetical protein
MGNRHLNCTVLVCSCDRYADLLQPFSVLWRKFWPDCPFETVLVTETAPLAASSLCFDRVIACGPGGNWCSRLVQALDKIETPYVLMLCDDYYLEAPVDTARILERLVQAQAFDAVNLRLIPNPKPSVPFRDGLFEYRKQTAYCIATQAGIWSRDFLRGLADGKASIWEFERLGSFAVADEKRPLLVTPTREFPFVDAVHKGCWEKFGLAVCRANGIEPDLSVRGLPPFRTRFVEGLKALVFAIFPASLIVRIQNALGSGAKEKCT